MENLESHGILQFHFPGLESHGMWVWVMESHGKWQNDFSEDSKSRKTLNKWSFLHYFENNFSILGHGKHQKRVLEKFMESHEICKIKRVRTVLTLTSRTGVKQTIHEKMG